MVIFIYSSDFVDQYSVIADIQSLFNEFPKIGWSGKMLLISMSSSFKESTSLFSINSFRKRSE